jgi:hypothetical protein
MVLTLKKIDKKLLAIDSDFEDKDFVSIAVLINDIGECQHSGFIIKLGDEFHLFHYTGKLIEIEYNIDNSQWYFFKTLDIIGEDEVLTFLHHCEEVKDNSPTPSYGFVYDGSYFVDGQYFTETGIQQFTTCVGFCLTIIKGFMHNHDEYLKLDDWDYESTQTEEFRNNYLYKFFEKNLAILEQNYPDRIEEIKSNYIKRITPSELTSSAFFDKLPIQKSEIDSIIDNVCLSLYNKRFNINTSA